MSVNSYAEIIWSHQRNLSLWREGCRHHDDDEEEKDPEEERFSISTKTLAMVSTFYTREQ